MKLRIVSVVVAIAALLVATISSTTSAATFGGPSDTADEAPAVLWATIQGSRTIQRGDSRPVNLAFKNSAPFPGIYFGYVDGSGKHFPVRLTFSDGTGGLANGYNLVVPNNLPLGKLKLATITIDGLSGAAGGQVGVGVHARNQEYSGLVPGGSGVPFQRKINIDFTKLDVTIQ